jgi:hypothetical protein
MQGIQKKSIINNQINGRMCGEIRFWQEIFAKSINQAKANS